MELKFFIIDAGYKIDDQVYVEIFGKKENGDRVLLIDRNFLPYFYAVPEGSIEKVADRLRALNVDGNLPNKVQLVSMNDGTEMRKILKITLNSPQQVPSFREAVRDVDGVKRTREDDIPFIRRYFIDHKLRPFGEVIAEVDDKGFVTSIKPGEKDKEPKILAFDIEVHTSGGLPRANQNPVIMISLWGEGLKKVISWQGPGPDYAEIVDSEKNLFEKFMQIVDEFDPDVLVGYNSDNFDIPYLRDRASKLGVRFKILGERIRFTRRGRYSAPKNPKVVILDVFTFVDNVISKNMKTESLKLDVVAQELLGGDGKYDLSWEDMIECWESGKLEPLFKYSLKDSELTYQLARKLFPVVFALGRQLNIPVFDISRMTSGQIIEWFLVSKAKQENILVPNKPGKNKVRERISRTFKGAFVREPDKGLHTNIAVCDFRSLYPTVIVAHNISPEMLGCDCCKDKNMAQTGDWFCTEKKGFHPIVLKAILTQRFELKNKLKSLKKSDPEYNIIDAQQKALKLMVNSFYGYLGFFGARWYCLECARATTSWGRKYIKDTMKLAENLGFKVIYGDTDSLFLSAQTSDFEVNLKKFMKDVNQKLPEMMELELEGIFKRGIFLTKKRYAMIDNSGKLVVKGLERVRRDWAPIARETQDKVLKILLDKADPAAAMEVVQAAISKLKKKQMNMDAVAIPIKLARNIEDYKQKGPHVRAAMRLQRMGVKVVAGTAFEYVITPGLGSISDKARPRAEAKDYDAEYYINHHLIPATQRIFDAFDMKVEEKDQTKLKKWFK